MMTYTEIKDALSDDDFVIDNSFLLLRNISKMLNDKRTEVKGRDLVIRVLSKKELFVQHNNVLESLIRTSGLFPYMTDFIDEDTSFQDLIAYEYHRPANMEDNIVLHSLQAIIYQEVLNGRNVVLSASTSIGKSMLIDSIIATWKFRNIVLVVPTIALIDETRQRLSKRFKNKCKVITHPSQSKSEDQALINVYILTQERLLNREDILDIDFFVIDEFYKLDPKLEVLDERAIMLNLALYKLLKVSKQFYLIGPNIDFISGLNKLGASYLFIPSNFKTVAVDLKRFNYGKNDPAREVKLIELVRTLDSSTLIYCQSPSSVARVAEMIISQCELKNTNELTDICDWIKDEYDEEWIFLQALRLGIGLHHGGIPRALQQQSIKLFNEGKLKFLICTSTIIEGVNTVAKNVIIYDRRMSTHLLDYFTYKNIEGRAGRMGNHFIGKVYSLEPPPEEEIMNVSIPIGEQDETTPLSLLLQIEQEDLSEYSQSRIEEEASKSILSIGTIKSNLPYTAEKQNAVAKMIRSDLLAFNDVLAWNGNPKQFQLIGVCNIIFDHLEQVSLSRNKIFSGDSLAYHINSLRSSEGISDYFEKRIEEERFNLGPNETIEQSLKILRNVLSFTFPRALRALENIQREVLTNFGIKAIGNYSVYGLCWLG